jgi:transcriptional regulator with XRE-family HTH domain
MITAEQIRAARVLLGLRQEELAQRAGMAVGTINSAELGTKATRPLTLKILSEVLTEAGVEFLPEDERFGPGVRLQDAALAMQDKSEGA